MPALTNLETRRRIEQALSQWHVTDEIVWKRLARAWVQQHLGGVSTTLIAELLYAHVRAGGRIQQVEETRAGLDAGCHYDFVLEIAGRDVYVESRLDDRDPSDPRLTIVNVHWAD